MNDYYNLLREYQDLKSCSRIQCNELNTVIQYIKSFSKEMGNINKEIALIPEVVNNSFDFFVSLTRKLTKDFNKSINLYSDITSPLEKLIQNININFEKYLATFNEIKTNIFEGKQKLIKVQNTYFDFIKSKLRSSKKMDDDLLYNGKKEHFLQLYKYEVNNMNELIEKNNEKYNKMKFDIDTIKFEEISSTKKILINFGNIIGEIGQKFINYQKDLNDKINSNPIFSKKSPEKIMYDNKIRFPKEKVKENEYEITNDDYYGDILNIDNNGNTSFDYYYHLNEENENLNINNLINENNRISENRNTIDDFELLEEPIMNSEENKEKNITLIKQIIDNLTSSEEVKSAQIAELIKLLKDNELNDTSYSKIFFEQIKERYNHRVITFKNRNNFIQLSNIMNNLCFKKSEKSDMLILNDIIEVSQMIKYENLYIFSLIRKKNPYFSSMSLWIHLIEDNLIHKLNIYIQKEFLNKKNKKNNNNEKIIDIKNIENKENKISKLDDIYDEIKKHIKLKKKQKDLIDGFIQGVIVSILSKAVHGMCSYLVPYVKSIDIINHFNKIFDFRIETFSYLQNLLDVKCKYIVKSVENNVTVYNNNVSKLFILSNASKYFERSKYIKLLQLSKYFNKRIKNNLFKNILSNYELPINDRIKIWDVILNINLIKNKYNYSEAKNKLLKALEKNDQLKNEKTMTIIDMDLARTPLFRDDENLQNKCSLILKSLPFVLPKFEYFQGMNSILLFFYQLLERNEEKTFHYFCALETQTDYRELFNNELSLLKKYFAAHEKLIEIKMPEIYYKLQDRCIYTHYYCSSWFITLFTCCSEEFDKETVIKYILLVFESFLMNGWSAIFCSGYTIALYFKEQILNLDGDDLMEFMIHELGNKVIIKNENFEELKELFVKNAEKINKDFIEKLKRIVEYENSSPFLKSTLI